MAMKWPSCPPTAAAKSFEWVRGPIDFNKAISQVQKYNRGGLVWFLGVVRDKEKGLPIEGIEYDFYPEMADKKMAALILETKQRWDVDIMIQHRLGLVPVGETSLLVLSAGTHRREAFDASQFMIDEIKKTSSHLEGQLSMEIKAPLRVGVLTISDRCYNGTQTDKTGPLLCEKIEDQNWVVRDYSLVSDDQQLIRSMLLKWSDRTRLDLILTTGGTGVGPRDGTPEATKNVLHKELPGVAELIRSESRKQTPLAVLSRGLAGLRNHSLIVNLPGNPRGAVDSLELILDLIPHILHVSKGGHHEHNEASQFAHTA